MTLRVLAFLIVGVYALECSAQSVVDVAKRERERQKQISSTRIFTNENIVRTDRPASENAEESPARAEPAEEAAQAVRGEAEWRADFRNARAELARNQDRVALLELQLNELNRQLLSQSDMYNRETRLLPQIQGTQENLEAARADIETATQAIADLRTALRRAGAPAAWGRP